MNITQNIQFIYNSDDSEALSHKSKLLGLFTDCTELICVVAFAKKSGLCLILNEVSNLIKSHRSVTFLIGLSFYQTERFVLNKIHQLQKSHPDIVKLYISNPSLDCTFHHKIYLFKRSTSHSVIIGSANLTEGGLCNNYESSILVNEQGSYELSEAISKNVSDMISSLAVIPADNKLLKEYEQKFRIASIYQAIAKRKVTGERDTDLSGIHALSEILNKMKNDISESGFSAQISHRTSTRKTAYKQLIKIADHQNLDAEKFIELYEPLVFGLWHSGGLQRAKNIIAANHEEFQQGLRALLSKKNISYPHDAYEILYPYFQKIPGGGVNVMTEILHSISSENFGIMNQNSASGMLLAGYKFPSHPLKSNVSSATYADFCKRGLFICEQLGLNDFTELDALFNYAYWV